MAVRWRTRRTAPAPADDGRWGVARLVAQREAERRGRAAVGRAEPAADPVDQGELTVEPAVEPAAEPAAESGPDDPRSSSVDSVPAPRSPRTPEPEPDPAAPPRPRRAPERTAPGPRRPRVVGAGDGPVYRPPAISARPRVELEPGLVGFSRLTRGRTGSRVFTLFFVGIYLVIIVHTLSTIV